jgi:hypothetical protein
MDRSDVITLVGYTQTQDAFGVWQSTQTQRDVFCSVDSVTRQEYFEGGRNGLNPEYRITMFFGDYNGEDTILYNGKAYGVYRTYHAKTDVLELYVERKGGVNRGENND